MSWSAILYPLVLIQASASSWASLYASANK